MSELKGCACTQTKPSLPTFFKGFGLISEVVLTGPRSSIIFLLNIPPLCTSEDVNREVALSRIRKYPSHVKPQECIPAQLVITEKNRPGKW